MQSRTYRTSCNEAMTEERHQQKLEYQRKYYREHREHVLAKVKECQKKRHARELIKLWREGRNVRKYTIT